MIRKIETLLESFFKTDIRYIARNAVYMLSSTAGIALINFGTLYVFANFVPQQVYGTYKFITTAIDILAVTSLGGIGAIIIEHVARGNEGIVTKGFKKRVMWGLVGSAGALAMATYYLIKGNSVLGLSFLITVPFIPIIQSLNVYTNFLEGKKDFKLVSKSRVIEYIVSASVIAATAYLTKDSVYITLAFVTSWTLVRALLFVHTIKKHKKNDLMEADSLSHGKHLTFVGVIQRAVSNLDSIIIFTQLGATMTALYSIAKAPTEQIRSVIHILPTLAVPKLSNRSIKEIQAIFYTRLLHLAGIGAGIVVLYIFCAPFIFKIFLPQYMDSVFYSQLLSIVMFIRLPTLFVSSILNSRISTNPPSWFYWRSASSVILIASLAVTIPLFKIYGVIGSYILYNLSIFVIYYIQWLLYIRRQEEVVIR